MLLHLIACVIVQCLHERQSAWRGNENKAWKACLGENHEIQIISPVMEVMGRCDICPCFDAVVDCLRTFSAAHRLDCTSPAAAGKLFQSTSYHLGMASSVSSPPSTLAVSSLFNWSVESGCASRSIGAILITCRQSTVDHWWSYITPSLWLFPCYSWFP